MTKDIDLAKFLTQERHDIHLVGVAGSGMSGIAGLLLQLGHKVSGSDKLDSLETDRLERLRLKIFCEKPPQDPPDAGLIIYFSAIRPGNPNFQSARDSGERADPPRQGLGARTARQH